MKVKMAGGRGEGGEWISGVVVATAGRNDGVGSWAVGSRVGLAFELTSGRPGWRAVGRMPASKLWKSCQTDEIRRGTRSEGSMGTRDGSTNRTLEHLELTLRSWQLQ